MTRHRLGGWTLLEFLLALTLLGMLVTIVYSSLWTGVQTWRRVATVAEESESLYLAEQFLRQTLTQTVSRAVPSSEPVIETIKGSRDALTFTAVLPDHLGVPGLYRVWLNVMQTRAGQSLTLRYALDHGSAGDLPSPTEYNVLLEAADIVLDYFGDHVNATRGGEWRANWSDEVGSLRLVRVTIKRHSGHTVAWSIPTTVKAPMKDTG